MQRIQILLALVLMAAPVAWAQYHAGDPRLDKLYGMFIAPCCWRENLTVHNSDVAREMRDRIRTMVRDGRTDNEIKAVFVKEYTTQVLALPEGSPRTWLFLTPWLAAIAGVAIFGLALKNLRTRSKAAAIGQHPAELEAGWDFD